MNDQRHIIFDLDGTIIDSKNEILKTYKIVFKEIPPETPPNAGLLDFSLTLTNLLKSVYGIEEDKIAKARLLFASVYDISDYDDTTLYEGVEETLNTLAQQGFKLYIATNKRHVPTLRILEKKGIKHLFQNVITTDTVPGRIYSKQEMIAEIKRVGSFDKGFMVGDSVSDIQAGNNENLITVAVNYGYEPEEALTAAKPACSIHSFRNLYNFVIKDPVYSSVKKH